MEKRKKKSIKMLELPLKMNITYKKNIETILMGDLKMT